MPPPSTRPEADRPHPPPGLFRHDCGRALIRSVREANRLDDVLGPSLMLESLLQRPFPLCMRRVGLHCWNRRVNPDLVLSNLPLCATCMDCTDPAADGSFLEKTGWITRLDGESLVEGLHQCVTYSVIADLMARVVAKQATGRDSGAVVRLV